MTITRRTLSKAIALGASSCLVPEVFAQASPDNTGIPNPYRSVNVHTDRSNVIFFFDFGCPFCAKLHDPFISWSTTTPKAIKVSMLPVVNASDAAKLREQIIAVALDRAFLLDPLPTGEADFKRRLDPGPADPDCHRSRPLG